MGVRHQAFWPRGEEASYAALRRGLTPHTVACYTAKYSRAKLLIWFCIIRVRHTLPAPSEGEGVTLFDRVRSLFYRLNPTSRRASEHWRDHPRPPGLWPVTNSFESVLAVTATGDVVGSEFTDFRTRHSVTDPRERNWILFEASQRYPELRHLCPVRQPGDLTCAQCAGTGKLPLPSELDNLVCGCGGLGWVPAETGEP